MDLNQRRWEQQNKDYFAAVDANEKMMAYVLFAILIVFVIKVLSGT